MKKQASILLFTLFSLCLMVTQGFAATATAGKRVALVIGNAAYQHSSKLVTPPNDVRTVSDRLKAAGFLVIEGVDQSKQQMVDVIRRFLRELDKDTVSLFYYSGHAVQVGGDNYLIPIDAKLASSYDLEQETFKFNNLLKYMENLSAAQLVFLDACRDNPFEGRNFITGQLTRSAGSSGLAPMKAGIGTLISYSTAPGQVAFDGAGEVSPFSGAFTNSVLKPATEVRQLLSLVRRDVIKTTKGMQVPWENSSLVENFFFVPPRPAPKIKPVHQVEVGVGERNVDIGLPIPYQKEGGSLRVTFTKLPESGKLRLKNRAISLNDTINAGDIADLTFDAGAVRGGEVAVTGYKVDDDWGNEKTGVIVIKAMPKKQAAAAPKRKRDGKFRLAALRSELAPRLASAFSMPIGVGAVPLNIKLAEGRTGRIEIVRPPAAGHLQLGGRKLVKGASFDIKRLAQLSYRPEVGTQGKIMDAQFAIAGDDGRSEILPARIKPEIHKCDRLAGQPFDLQGVAPGIYADKINGAKAKLSCLEALADYPSTGRFLFQLARAELALGEAGKARQLLDLAAKRGHIRADHTLGKLKERGGSGKVNKRLANAHYQAAALKGDVYGLYSYGKNLFHGRGVKANREKGLAHMLQAAEMGHTFAMNELSYIFRQGVGVKKDPKRAMRFSMASALRNDIYGFNNLAIHFLNGSGVSKDYEKALAWFLKAHKGGHPEAANNIGRMYQNGWGVPQNADIAVGWYEKSAVRGSAWAANNRAWFAQNGPKHLQSQVTAAKYYALSVAIDHGNASAAGAKRLAVLDAGTKRKAAQLVLTELGYKTGGTDGRFGATTKKAISRFVRTHKGADTGSTDRLLVSLAKAWWLKNKPRFDLF